MAAPLSTIIAETLSPVAENRKQAESLLKDAQKTEGHLLRVLEIVAQNDAAQGIRQAASVHFKNAVKKGWDSEHEDEVVISPNDRNLIKSHLLRLMCTTPPQVQVQLSEAISLISLVDYPQQWPDLMPDLVKQFESPDNAVVSGVLKTAHGMFRNFRYKQRSDELYTKIKYSLEHVQEPLLRLYQLSSQKVDEFANNTAQLKPVLENLRIMSRMFFSLNYQDLPEYFEDHMAEWMALFEKFLTYQNPALVDPDEEDEPSPIETLQVAIIQNLALYSDKDEEVFLPFLPKFTTMVWNLLMSISAFPKYDTLATTSIRFLANLVAKPMHKHLFEAEGTLREIVLKIVIPNLQFRDSDQERFEDDPNEFIATEVEGSDGESRRTCSRELLRCMCRQFDGPTTTICSEHVNSMLEEFRQNPNGKWAAKDAAIHLVMGIAVRRSSDMYGVSEVNDKVNIIEFFQTQILPELQDKNHATRPVVKATAIKFVSVFRNQFARDHLKQLLPIIIEQLSSPVVVVHTFASYTIELLLSCKEAQNTKEKKVKSEDLKPILHPLCGALFTIIDNVDQNENTYAMKCMMRALSRASSEDILPITGEVITKLTSVLERVARNPSNPQFNHYMFESIAVLIKTVCSVDAASVASFEQLLFSPFTMILQADTTEFTPYVFQLLAQLLEFRPPNSGLGEAYAGLFPPMLHATLWENKGNVPPLARLIQAYLMQAGGELSQHMTAVLGIFQKLVASAATEIHAFEILTSCILHFPQEEILNLMNEVLRIILTRLQARLQKSMSGRYVSCFTRFCSVFMHKFGTDSFFKMLEGFQAGLALNLLGNIWLRGNGPSNRHEAKAQAVGLTKILCEAPLLADANGQAIWGKFFLAQVALLTSRSFDRSLEGTEDDIEIRYDSAFSQLSFARKRVEDPFENVDPLSNFATSLHTLSTSNATVITVIQAAVRDDPKAGTGLQSILNGANVSLAI